MLTLEENIKQTSFAKISAKSKRFRLIGKAALSLAKKENDPAYIRYAKARAIYRKEKMELLKKYGRKAIQVLAKR